MWSIIALTVSLVCVVSIVAVVVSGVWSRGSAPARPVYFTFTPASPARLMAIMNHRQTESFKVAEIVSAVEDCEGLHTIEICPPPLPPSVQIVKPVLCTEDDLNNMWSAPPVWADVGIWCE